MTSLFAMRGAHVTMVEKGSTAEAAAETARWGVSDRVHLIQTRGDLKEIASRTFDIIFTKSVLWSIGNLGAFLDSLEPLLAEGGKVAFVENYRGGKAMFWLRRNVIHRGQFEWGRRYFGITPTQLPLFSERFADVYVRRKRLFVYEIFGRKR